MLVLLIAVAILRMMSSVELLSSLLSSQQAIMFSGADTCLGSRFSLLVSVSQLFLCSTALTAPDMLWLTAQVTAVYNCCVPDV